MVLGRGEFLGALFAALLGAMSITVGSAMARSGRPSLHSKCHRVVAARVLVSIGIGAGFGLVAGAAAGGRGHGGAPGSGIELQLDERNYVLVVAGSAAAAALWAAIGVGEERSFAARCPRWSASARGSRSSRVSWPAISSASARSDALQGWRSAAPPARRKTRAPRGARILDVV